MAPTFHRHVVDETNRRVLRQRTGHQLADVIVNHADTLRDAIDVSEGGTRIGKIPSRDSLIRQIGAVASHLTVLADYYGITLTEAIDAYLDVLPDDSAEEEAAKEEAAKEEAAKGEVADE